jgi:hypothetical protein
MMPSATNDGSRWVENFDPDDRVLAASLIDSVRFVSSDAFHGDMRELLDSYLKSTLAPTAVLPYAKPNSSGAFESIQDLLPGGSDYVVAELCERSAARTAQSLLSSVARLRDERTRRLAVVTDSVGSGDQVLGLINFIYANGHVKSWVSGGFLRFDVLAYTISSHGLSRLKADKRIGEVRWVEITRDISSLSIRGDQLERLSARYGRGKALGWDGKGGLTVFAHSVPNNTPLIFRQTRGPQGRDWRPITDQAGRKGGLLPGLEVDLGNYKPEVRVQDIAHLVGLNRLGRLDARDLGRLAKGASSSDAIGVLKILTGVRAGYSIDDIAREFLMSSPEFAQCSEAAQFNGFLDKDFRLTPKGRGYLKFAASRRSRLRVHAPPQLYYPQTLR